MIEDKIDKYLNEVDVAYPQLKKDLGEIDTAINNVLKYYERPNPDHKVVLRDLQKIQKMVKKAKTSR